MSEQYGGKVNYYLVQVDHPQREDQLPYQAECEDIAEALQLTPNEFCEFKAIWRTAAARLGNGKPDHKALYDTQKRVHYATRDLRKLEREKVVKLRDEETIRREVYDGVGVVQGFDNPVEHDPVEGGWFIHSGDRMPDMLSNEQLVEVRMQDGQEYIGNFAKPASDWLWITSGGIRAISHYRLLRFDTGCSVPGELDKSKELVTKPGWYHHSGGPRPAGIAQRDMVKVRLSNGHEVAVPREGYKWNWEYRQDSPTAAPHIEAWRFA